MPGLTDAQNRVHMSLWAISGGPLIAGADLTKLSASDIAPLTNRAVLRIDQDPLGLQAVKAAEAKPGLQVWSKPLVIAGTRAVLLLNRTAADASISVAWKDLGLAESAAASVRDLWAAKDIGPVETAYSAVVPAGDALLLLVQGTEAPSTDYPPDTVKPPAAAAPVPPASKSTAATFSHVTSRFPIARVRITYTNPDKATRFVELRVNGQPPTRIAFAPTGADISAELSVEAVLKTGGAENSLVFSPLGEPRPVSEPGPAIQSITLQ
jgi:hypothetical protein